MEVYYQVLVDSRSDGGGVVLGHVRTEGGRKQRRTSGVWECKSVGKGI